MTATDHRPGWPRLIVVSGTRNPNCVCLSDRERTPGCPQHPGGNK